jgi:molybdopterin/thiamine biosynthesis adenylyltransferase
MDLTDDQIDRYARHLVLPEIGEEGQARLLGSRVLVIGAGGLGSPLLLYLAAAGVGTLGIIDEDTVDLSNLQRQVIHATPDIGRPKVESAAERLGQINPEVRIEPHSVRLTAENALDLIQGYDLVADGSDNFATRYLVNDACYLAKRTLVSAAIMRFDGQLSTFKAHLGGDNPCYRCLFGEEPPESRESCADVGVLTSLAGVMGTLQATEVLKELMGIGTSLSGKILLYESLESTVRKIQVAPDPACELCGERPNIRAIEPGRYGVTGAGCAA